MLNIIFYFYHHCYYWQSAVCFTHSTAEKSLATEFQLFLSSWKPPTQWALYFISAEQKRVMFAVIFLMSPLPGTVLHWANTSPSPLMLFSWPAAPSQCQGAHFGSLLLTSSFYSLHSPAGVQTWKSYSDTSINRCSSLKHYYIY